MLKLALMMSPWWVFFTFLWQTAQAVELSYAQGPSKIKWLETRQNLGQVWRGQIIEFDYRYQNTGSGPLEILGVKSGCACVVVEESSELILAPNATASLKFKLDTRDFEGSFERRIGIVTNEGAKRFHELDVSAEIKSELRVSPPIVDFAKIDPHLIYSKSVEIESDYENLDIRAIHAKNSDFYSFNLQRINTRTWRVDISIQPGLATGFWKDTLIVETNAKNLKQLPLPVRADVVGHIDYEPKYVEFGTIALDEIAERALVLRSERSWNLESTKIELLINGSSSELIDEFVSFEHSSDGKLTQLKVALKNTGSYKGAFSGKLHLTSSDDKHEKLQVPFFGFFEN